MNPLLAGTAVRRAFVAVLAAAMLLTLAACETLPCKWKSSYDPPMNYEGREQICLSNLERLLDAKQEWAKETGAQVGQLCPSPEVLAHRYFRMYEYGRRAPCDDDTQNLPVYQAICPAGGEYIIGAVGERPKCTRHGDLLRIYDTRMSAVKHTH